jgi:hypothetical protein
MMPLWASGESTVALYFIFENRLEKMYEAMGEASIVVPPNSETGMELSRRWREYLNGLGVSYSREYDHKKPGSVRNPLYTEPDEFNYIVLEQDVLDKILVIGLP